MSSIYEIETVLSDRILQIEALSEDLTDEQGTTLQTAKGLVGSGHLEIEDQARFNVLVHASSILNELASVLGIQWPQRIVWRN